MSSCIQYFEIFSVIKKDFTQFHVKLVRNVGHQVRKKQGNGREFHSGKGVGTLISYLDVCFQVRCVVCCYGGAVVLIYQLLRLVCFQVRCVVCCWGLLWGAVVVGATFARSHLSPQRLRPSTLSMKNSYRYVLIKQLRYVL